MKKWIGLLLAGILVSAVLTGCGKKDEEGAPATTPTDQKAPGTQPKADEGGKMDEKKGTSSTEGETTAPAPGGDKMAATPPAGEKDTAATPPATTEKK